MILLDAIARHGDRPAIEAADGRVTTYAELLAHAQCHMSPTVVEVPAERTVAFIARCLGAWLGGGAFRPIDPCDPRPRPPITFVDGLAYVIATSGSTGSPRHVLVGHRGVPALLETQVEAFALGPDARSLWLHEPMFDASISDWGTALLAGATLVLPTASATTRLSDELASRQITHVDLPAALLARLDPPPSLRVVVLGGEACDVETVRALARTVRVVVVYGPTEATVCSSLVVVDPERWTRPLIGQPLPGITYRVIDGELRIVGDDALALGYAGDDEETARRFVTDVHGTRAYHTGDRVEETPHGLAFLGRIDRQCKLRGRRIELDEIELALRRIVDDAAVVVRAQRVVAFVSSPVDRARVLEALPAWMVPARFIVGPLPRTATGKLDRTALVVPPSRATDPLARAWCEALGVDRVTEERFSAAGGDSLARLTFEVMTGVAIEGDPTFRELRASVPTPLTVAACEARGRGTVSTFETIPERGPNVETVPSQDKAVLVTGATGFLGRALVRAWRLREPHRRIIALVRDPSVALEVDEVVCGDIRDDAWHHVRDRVAAVVHCAATVQLGGDWDAHVDTNVRGTAQIARFVGDDIAWHHVSTLSVFVNTDARGVGHQASTNPAPEALAFGGYAQTKIAAEAIARACGAWVYRLGLLAGRADDQRAMTLRALARLRAVPEGFRDRYYDETPVAFAAEAIARLAHEPAATFHIAAGSTRFGDVIDRMQLAELPHGVWLERARACGDDPDVVMAIAAFSRRPALDLFLATGADFGVTR